MSISEVDEVEIFKICLEYWGSLAAELYQDLPFSAHSPLIFGSKHLQEVLPRRQLYNSVLAKVCMLLYFIFVLHWLCFL